MTYKNILVAGEQEVAVLTFNRPQVLNALNTATVAEALEAMQCLEQDSAVRVIILTGAGRAFVAGADIAEMSSKTPEQARAYSELGHRLMNRIQYMDKPVIAAVNGYALGGGTEVALCCDIRIASEKAHFGLPEAILGIIPGWGATQRAARLIGPALTKELIFTGQPIDARRAMDIGLVNRVVAHETLMPAAMDMAHKISCQGQLALAQAKRVINQGIDQPLPEGCRMEIDAFVSLFTTQDHREGMQAFVEKRKPNFKGC